MMMHRWRVMVVDDEETIRFALRNYLETHGYAVEEADSIGAARNRLRTQVLPDAVVLDYRLQDGTSLDLIPEIKAIGPDIALVVLTAHGTIDLAVTAVKSGADHFMTKPIELDALRIMIDRMVTSRRALKRDAAARSHNERGPIDPFLGTSAEMTRLRDEARRVAASDRPILILGETGSGKGVLAQWIHRSSPRTDEPFVDLNCAGFSRELVESELFGHERGAFTGAVVAKPGLLEIGAGGTVFLDEIGDMDVALQAKLLKAVEEKRFHRIGDVRDRQVDIRLIAATSRDLAAMVRQDKFRSDLYFRISTITFSLPPLRQRREDIPLLAETFLLSLAAELGRRAPQLDDEALAALQRYGWPGNVRELRNVIERALLLTDSDVITARDLRFDRAAGGVPQPPMEKLEDVEREHIVRILAEENGRVERAAARLGIPRSSLYQKLKRYPRG